MSQVNLGLPILLIDDDGMVRSILEEYLRSFGFRNIISIRDPKDALKVIRDTKVDIGLILSDWEMPGINGLTLLKAVRNSPRRGTTKFMMITSQQSMERFKITKAAHLRVNDYLVKPFSADALRQRICRTMGWSDDALELVG